MGCPRSLVAFLKSIFTVNFIRVVILGSRLYSALFSRERSLYSTFMWYDPG